MAEYRVNFKLRIWTDVLYLKRRPGHPVVFIHKATQTNEMHGECHGVTFSCTFLYRKTFRKQSHWICRRQLTLWGCSTVPVLVIRKCGAGSILTVSFDAVTDWTVVIASLICRWIVTAWLLPSSLFRCLLDLIRLLERTGPATDTGCTGSGHLAKEWCVKPLGIVTFL